MSKVKYKYNHRTLRYERAGFPWESVILTLLSLGIFGFLSFGGLLFLQNRLTETELERKLRSENEALSRHRGPVQNEIAAAEVKLTSLTEKEGKLFQRIFLKEKETVTETPSYTKEMLGSELPQFYSTLNQIRQKTEISFWKAASNNYEFSKLFWPKKTDVNDLQSYPTQPPVARFSMEMLASGFGNQINPFNKLLYVHSGVDIVGERGTPVVASANGRVIALETGELPAGLGTYVEIEHAEGYRTKYAHLEGVQVIYGQRIKQGQRIGTMGMSGSAIAPHLHFEITKNGRHLNPLFFFVENMDEAGLSKMAEFSRKINQSLD